MTQYLSMYDIWPPPGTKKLNNLINLVKQFQEFLNSWLCFSFLTAKASVIFLLFIFLRYPVPVTSKLSLWTVLVPEDNIFREIWLFNFLIETQFLKTFWYNSPVLSLYRNQVTLTVDHYFSWFMINSNIELKWYSYTVGDEFFRYV